ncbi:MAG: glycosyltransferase [Proteobacteria bacterium]|nr:glycosyltransferase [Pseudomonadota bacterium]
MNVNCIIPTYEAGASWSQAIEALQQQTALTSEQVFVIDSSSNDNTVLLSKQAGFRVHVIPSTEFNHGGTRQLAVNLLHNSDIVVFLTQDALLASKDAIQKLVAVFDDAQVGCAYGRQLPHADASVFASHARLFNYGKVSYIRTLSDVPSHGIKTAFLSNSFAAYRMSALKIVGGFPGDLILAEDMVVAARMLQANYKVAYVADACVYHSHNYTPAQEFKRYFDIGVLHAREPWLLQTFGKPTGEGRRFVLSEWRYVLKCAPWLLPLSVINTAMKWLGYSLGKKEYRLPLSVKRHLSMVKGYWK